MYFFSSFFFLLFLLFVRKAVNDSFSASDTQLVYLPSSAGYFHLSVVELTLLVSELPSLCSSLEVWVHDCCVVIFSRHHRRPHSTPLGAVCNRVSQPWPQACYVNWFSQVAMLGGEKDLEGWTLKIPHGLMDTRLQHFPLTLSFPYWPETLWYLQFYQMHTFLQCLSFFFPPQLYSNPSNSTAEPPHCFLNQNISDFFKCLFADLN